MTLQVRRFFGTSLSVVQALDRRSNNFNQPHLIGALTVGSEKEK
jgi:hypothetical protein